MIPLSLGEIAEIVGGKVAGDSPVTVTAPAVPDSRQAEPGGLFVAFADGAGERAVALADNEAAVHWLRGHLAPGDAVLVKASRGARLDEVSAALA